jgi:hypothetical protein
MELSCELPSREWYLKSPYCKSYVRAGRLWTFQEGVLSRGLHFQFRDRALHKDDEILHNKQFFQQRRQDVQQRLHQDIGEELGRGDWKWIAKNKSRRVWDVGMDDLLAAAKASFGQVHGDAPSGMPSRDYERLAFISPVFKWRSTSKAEDKAICMAVLLGQRTSPLVSLQPPE